MPVRQLRLRYRGPIAGTYKSFSLRKLHNHNHPILVTCSDGWMSGYKKSFTFQLLGKCNKVLFLQIRNNDRDNKRVWLTVDAYKTPGSSYYAIACIMVNERKCQVSYLTCLASKSILCSFLSFNTHFVLLILINELLCGKIWAYKMHWY